MTFAGFIRLYCCLERKVREFERKLEAQSIYSSVRLRHTHEINDDVARLTKGFRQGVGLIIRKRI